MKALHRRPRATPGVGAIHTSWPGRRCSPPPLAGPVPMPITALAVQHFPGRILWLINTTDQPQSVTVEKLDHATATLCRLNAQTYTQQILINDPADIVHGRLALTLGPYEVCQVTFDEFTHGPLGHL